MTPLFKKLNFKNHQEILVLKAPESFLLEKKNSSFNNRVAKRKTVFNF